MPRARKQACLVRWCGILTSRVLTVAGIPSRWPTCGTHGRATIEALMGLYPGKAIHSNGRTVRGPKEG